MGAYKVSDYAVHIGKVETDNAPLLADQKLANRPGSRALYMIYPCVSTVKDKLPAESQNKQKKTEHEMITREMHRISHSSGLQDAP